jgi:hypothetical protein
MNKKIFGIAVAFLIVTMLASPVMAIGPWQAIESNPNIDPPLFGGLRNDRGDASGGNLWAYSTTNHIWVQWKFRDGADVKGLMNNAVIAHTPADLSNYGGFGDTEYENKWIYLSGDGGSNPNQFRFPIDYSFPNIPAPTLYNLGEHGMLWWFFFFAFKSPSAANDVAANYPNGAFFLYNNFDNNAPAP